MEPIEAWFEEDKEAGWNQKLVSICRFLDTNRTHFLEQLNVEEPRENVPERGVRMFQIKEPDLAELEHALPEILTVMYPDLNARLRVQWRRIREILTDVRWDYGPPDQVEIIQA